MEKEEGGNRPVHSPSPVANRKQMLLPRAQALPETEIQPCAESRAETGNTL